MGGSWGPQALAVHTERTGLVAPTAPDAPDAPGALAARLVFKNIENSFLLFAAGGLGIVRGRIR